MKNNLNESLNAISKALKDASKVMPIMLKEKISSAKDIDILLKSFHNPSVSTESIVKSILSKNTQKLKDIEDVAGNK